MHLQRLLAVLCGSLLGLLAGCAARRQFPFQLDPSKAACLGLSRSDYLSYRRIPWSATSLVYRVCLKAFPFSRGRAFYGHYGGNGNEGGYPIDAMDEIFRRHDIVYREADSLRTLRWADEACVGALRLLDPSRLSPVGREFRERTILFMTSERSRWLGKPVPAFFHHSESTDGPFQCRGDVLQFFGLREDGIPLKSAKSDFLRRNRPPAPQGARSVRQRPA